jgi:predicted  nucleic acid-binding Zn-ribbon protein
MAVEDQLKTIEASLKLALDAIHDNMKQATDTDLALWKDIARVEKLFVDADKAAQKEIADLKTKVKDLEAKVKDLDGKVAKLGKK